MAVYFTRAGIKKYQDMIDRYVKELEQMQSRVTFVAEHCGDGWHDNPTYNQLTGEIRQTNQLIVKLMNDRAGGIVVDPPTNADTVRIGTIVTVLRNGEEETWIIGGFGESDVDESITAYDTPLGNLLLGKREDEEFEGKIVGKNVRFKILKIRLPAKG